MSPSDPVPRPQSLEHAPEGDGPEGGDRQLGQRFLGGDQDAARELYLKYYERLLRFVISYVRSRAVAEDIVQETFLATWERRETLEFRNGIRMYLYTAVRNRALKYWEHEQVVDQAAGLIGSTELPGMGSPPSAADDKVTGDELARIVAAAIDAMPERRRLAITLRWRHRLPYAEIAQIMGSSVEAVTIQVARARETLAKTVERYRA